MADTATAVPQDEAAKTKETPRQHFKRLAGVRVNNIIEWSEKLGRLGNPNLYEYTDEDITKIEEALTKATSGAIAALKNGGKVEGFSLD